MKHWLKFVSITKEMNMHTFEPSPFYLKVHSGGVDGVLISSHEFSLVLCASVCSHVIYLSSNIKELKFV